MLVLLVGPVTNVGLNYAVSLELPSHPGVNTPLLPP